MEKMNMIKKVKYNVFDVWFGKGWDNWIRMEYVNNKWVYIAGHELFEKGAASLLSSKINKGRV